MRTGDSEAFSVVGQGEATSDASASSAEEAAKFSENPGRARRRKLRGHRKKLIDSDIEQKVVKVPQVEFVESVFSVSEPPLCHVPKQKQEKQDIAKLPRQGGPTPCLEGCEKQETAKLPRQGGVGVGPVGPEKQNQLFLAMLKAGKISLQDYCALWQDAPMKVV
jgi:hypothetical protein